MKSVCYCNDFPWLCVHQHPVLQSLPCRDARLGLCVRLRPWVTCTDSTRSKLPQAAASCGHLCNPSHSLGAASSGVSSDIAGAAFFAGFGAARRRRPGAKRSSVTPRPHRIHKTMKQKDAFAKRPSSIWGFSSSTGSSLGKTKLTGSDFSSCCYLTTPHGL